MAKRIAWDSAESNEFWTDLHNSARIVSPSIRLDVIKNDPADNRVLEAAIAARAGLHRLRETLISSTYILSRTWRSSRQPALQPSYKANEMNQNYYHHQPSGPSHHPH